MLNAVFQATDATVKCYGRHGVCSLAEPTTFIETSVTLEIPCQRSNVLVGLAYHDQHRLLQGYKTTLALVHDQQNDDPLCRFP